jgi:hypothetical protein
MAVCYVIAGDHHGCPYQRWTDVNIPMVLLYARYYAYVSSGSTTFDVVMLCATLQPATTMGAPTDTGRTTTCLFMFHATSYVYVVSGLTSGDVVCYLIQPATTTGAPTSTGRGTTTCLFMFHATCYVHDTYSYMLYATCYATCYIHVCSMLHAMYM